MTLMTFNLGPSTVIPDRGRKIFAIGWFEVGVFRVGEKLFAYENSCPHLGGPVCQGKIIPRAEEPIATDGVSLGLTLSKTAVHVACPWHGYEFDIATGRHPGNRQRLKPVPITVEDGDILVSVSADQLRGSAVSQPG